MSESDTSISIAQKNPLLSTGYRWDKEKAEFIIEPMRKIDTIAPAGSINSNIRDMSQWLRLLLAKGKYNDKQIIKTELLQRLDLFLVSRVVI